MLDAIAVVIREVLVDPRMAIDALSKGEDAVEQVLRCC